MIKNIKLFKKCQKIEKTNKLTKNVFFYNNIVSVEILRSF